MSMYCKIDIVTIITVCLTYKLCSLCVIMHCLCFENFIGKPIIPPHKSRGLLFRAPSLSVLSLALYTDFVVMKG